MVETMEDKVKRLLKSGEKWVDEDKGKRSWNKLARLININPSVISQIRSGIYKGRLTTFVRNLESYLLLQDKRASINIEPDFTPTRQGEQILKMAGHTKILRSISVIISSSGIGKTMALKHYAATTPGVYYIQADPFLRSKYQFLRKLCEIFNIRGATRNQANAFEAVKEKASIQGALLIYDDSQSLVSANTVNTTIFEIIRTLNDAGVGIILAGNGRLRDCITNSGEEEFYQQLASRSELLHLSETFSREDVEAVIHALIIDELSEEVIDYLFALANDCIGSLRVMIRVLTFAALRVQAQKGTKIITVQHLKDAAQLKISQPKNLSKSKGGIVGGKIQRAS